MFKWREYTVYNPQEYKIVLPTLFKNVPLVYDKKKRKTYNKSASFDIETSSFVDYGQAVATMYVWQFCFNGTICIGRTWPEFLEVIDAIHTMTNERKRLIIYVHNLGFEFQFIQHFFVWDNVYARNELKPIYAEEVLGITFKCSYFLSGYALKILADRYTPDVQKGKDFDYTKLRNNQTSLTRNEIEYCIRDVVILDKFITQETERNGGKITNIPNTQTGYTRRVIKQNMYPANDLTARQYSEQLMKSLTIDTLDEYIALKYAYTGGYVHANAYKVKQTLTDVSSYDISSSYPTVICSELFPMSKSKHYEQLTIIEYQQLTKTHNIIARFDFENIQPVDGVPDNILSYSKAIPHTCVNPLINNGRIVSADKVSFYLTEVDMSLLNRFYEWDTITITDAYAYIKLPLPEAFIKTAVDLFQAKTIFKNVEGKEAEYLHAKELLNSIYGCMVTDILQDKIEYKNHQWTTIDMDAEYELYQYNNGKRRCFYYPWGVYVTSYARRNIFLAILNAGSDYVYTDTDSVKLEHGERHTEFFIQYNETIKQKIATMMDYYHISSSQYPPHDYKGRPVYMGVFDNEGVAQRFKTLGAKRYLVQQDGKYKLTVAGVSKDKGLKYITSFKKRDPFNVFRQNLTIPADKSGKLAAYYFHQPIAGELKDYRGYTAAYEELSYVSMHPAAYKLSLSGEFENFIEMVQFGIQKQTTKYPKDLSKYRKP